MNGKDKNQKKFNEWEMFKAKFGKGAYIIFPLVHVAGLAIVVFIIILIIRSCS